MQINIVVSKIKQLPHYVFTAIKEMLGKFGKFDKAVAILFLVVIPLLLFGIWSYGLYCTQGITYADVIKDCPAINLSYTGNPFWSLSAITSNFIHDKSIGHIADNLASNYLYLLTIYFFAAIFLKNGTLSSVFPVSFGILIAFILTVLFGPFISMLYFIKMPQFGLPTYGYSSVTNAFLGLWAYFMLNAPAMKNSIFSKITPLITVILLCYLAFGMEFGGGNPFIHVVGLMTGAFAGLLSIHVASSKWRC